MKPAPAAPGRAALEAFLVGAALAGALRLLIPAAAPQWQLRQGVALLAAPAAAIWAAVRLREGAGGVVALAAVLLGADAVRAAWLGPGLTLPHEIAGIVYVTFSSLVFLGTRALRWLVDAFRRRAEASLGWGLARAQLLVLTLVLAAALLPLVLRFTGSAHVRAFLPPGAGLREGVALELVIGLLPKLWIAAAVLGVSLAILLPPLLLVATRVTRGTVRRLEGLMEQAAAIRDGRTFAPRLVEGRDEVARLQAHLNEMAARLHSALGALGTERDRVAALLESRRQLLVNVSHEVRTPLTALKVQVESLEGAEPLRREVERLEALLEDLFTLARADVGKLDVAREPIDVARLLSGVAETFRPLLWQQARLELVTDLPSGLPRARGDARRLTQVVGNLLHNALRHAAPGGIVVLGAGVSGDGVVVEVRDTGPGIDPEDLPRLFERFFHGGGGSGTGLGLAIVKELVEAMGGRVEVESPPGEGTTFRISLPA